MSKVLHVDHASEKTLGLKCTRLFLEQVYKEKEMIIKAASLSIPYRLSGAEPYCKYK
jgi:hypothetical protein